MRKTIVCLLALVLLLTSFSMVASAAQPDRTYTYDNDLPVPSTTAYQVMTIVDAATMGTTALCDARDIFVDNSDRVFVVDFIADETGNKPASANSRILVLDKNYKCIKELREFKHGEEILTLKGAEGVFYREANDRLYIADTGNNRIIVSDLEGNVYKIYEQPVDELIDPSLSFKPTKIIVDNMGIMYVISGNINTGALLMDSAGSFLGFYGTNKVKETAAMKVERMWRRLMKDAASGLTAQPVQFLNLFWSEDRFVYTVSPLSESVVSSVSKLNALGNNVFPQAIDLYTLQTTRKLSSMTLQDITVDNEGAITIIDMTTCRIFQYDEGCNLLAVFGGKGYQQGLFQQPSAIESDSKNRLLILDSTKNTITVMEQTFYGEMIRSANYLYNQGLYEESIEPWMEVLRMNANYTQAYVGLGKAYMSLGEYKTAMEYFELGKDAAGYGEAKMLLRDEIIRRNFALVAAVVVIAMFSILGWDTIKAVYNKLYWRFQK